MKFDNFYDAFTPYSEEELKLLEEEAEKETTQLYELGLEKEKVDNIVKRLINQMDIRKIVCDLYVWQRVDAVKRGIQKAIAKIGVSSGTDGYKEEVIK